MGKKDGVGSNPNEALSKGDTAEALANAMNNLDGRFEDVVSDAGAAAKEGLKSSYVNYAEWRMSFIKELQVHGQNLSENLKAGAGETKKTDDDNTNDFESSRRGLSRSVNH
ncbi:hypothetical protein NOGI109294_20270 [Nocardiopsis gilva]|uniref:hypothetical protein n=1 Tax=Nocardiopsis gilva TaxID=280236 RepID=UPI0012684BBF|nr:hypothetical protein [Nocardiopsis gilva]